MAHWTDKLTEMHACPDAIAWAKQHLTSATAWEACKRPDWMLWVASLLAKSQADRQAIVHAAAACARTALRYVPVGENRPLAAIEAAERWAENPSEKNRAAAWAAARAAADAEAAAWVAAWAAAEAAAEAAAAGWAAVAAARAAEVAAAGWARAAEVAAAGWAAVAAARDTARDAANREIADIVRKFIGIRLSKGQYVLVVNKQ